MTHPLTHSRISAAIGLLGLLGFGVSVMTGAPPHLNFLLWLGFAISILGGFGTTWLFWVEIKQFSRWSVVIIVVVVTETLVPLALIANTFFTTAPLSTISTTRTAFSQVALIKMLPPILGGIDTINLDNVAILKFFAPYSVNGVTMILDASPTEYPPHKIGEIEVDGVEVTRGKKKSFYFDTDINRQKEIIVAGRTFIVTLMSTRILPFKDVATPFEYDFGISER